MFLDEIKTEIAKEVISVKMAKEIARFIEADITIGGIFPNAQSGDFNNYNIEFFRTYWGENWQNIKINLVIARLFINKKSEKSIVALIKLGNWVNVPKTV